MSSVTNVGSTRCAPPRRTRCCCSSLPPSRRAPAGPRRAPDPRRPRRLREHRAPSDVVNPQRTTSLQGRRARARKPRARARARWRPPALLGAPLPSTYRSDDAIKAKRLYTSHSPSNAVVHLVHRACPGYRRSWVPRIEAVSGTGARDERCTYRIRVLSSPLAQRLAWTGAGGGGGGARSVFPSSPWRQPTLTVRKGRQAARAWNTAVEWGAWPPVGLAAVVARGGRAGATRAGVIAFTGALKSLLRKRGGGRRLYLPPEKSAHRDHRRDGRPLDGAGPP